MADERKTKDTEHKQDIINLLILVLITSVIGIYLIATTVLVAKDGVFYIERAQKLASDPVDIIKSHPPGYPLLILAAHKFVTLFNDNPSIFTWIYTAQGVTLLCRLIALIAIYLVGKFFVGSRRSFWAVLILIILPYPAEFGSSVLRDWPHILFLAAGFLLLIWGAKQCKCWMFGAAGLAAGIGHIIRPECVQLVIYGALWILIRFFLPKHNMNRPALLCALSVLLIGFAIPAAPYMKVRGEILPRQMRLFISTSDLRESETNQEVKPGSIASIFPSKIVRAIGRIIVTFSEDLMYYFLPALLIGIYFRFCRWSVATDIERFFLPVLVAFNVVTLSILYCYWGYISRRHCLPLVVFTIFYVPVGLQVSTGWLMDSFSGCRLGFNQNRQSWFFVLLIIGTAICLPKLFGPIRAEKQGYRTAAKWLMENTTQGDLIAVPDKRISFYAQRQGLIYDKKVPKQAGYVVRIVKNENPETNFGGAVQEKYSVWVDKHKKGKKLVIYRMM